MATRLSHEHLKDALRKKKECNAKAQAVVESLLEKNNNAREFLDKLKYINKCHYDDIVDERHILHYCGYPLCASVLENIPQKRYEISTATKKVYDITARKKFCSASCFKASEYIKSQILTSPLWLRNNESIPTFKLIVNDENTCIPKEMKQ